jgi:hypothetical protein
MGMLKNTNTGKKTHTEDAEKHEDDKKHKIFKWQIKKNQYLRCGVVKDADGKNTKTGKKTNTGDTEWC